MEDLRIRLKKIGNALMLGYSGNFDFDMDNLTEDYVEELLTSQSKTIILDLKKVKKAASSFINRLVKILRTVENENGRLFLVNVPESIIKVLSMVNIIGRFSIFRSEEEINTIFGNNTPDTEETQSNRNPQLKIYKSIDNLKHVFTLQGSFVEGANTSLLIEDVKSSINQGANSIVLDFERVEVLDTMSVGLLLSLHKMCGEKGITISITNANDVVSHVLNMNDVGKTFNI